MSIISRVGAGLTLALLVLPAGASRAAAAYDLEQVLAAVGAADATPLADQAVATQRARLQRARAAFEWQFNASVSAGEAEFYRRQDGFLTADTDTEAYLSTRLGARRQFRNGVVVRPAATLSSGFDDDRFEASERVGSGVGVGVTVPLSGWGQPSVAVAGERAAAALLSAAELSAQRARELEVAGAAAEFWQVLATAGDLALAEQLVDLNRDAAAVLERLAAQGAIDLAALADGKRRLRDARLDANAARQRWSERRWVLASRLAGGGEVAELPVFVGELPEPRPPPESGPSYLHRLVSAAEANRPDLGAAGARRDAAASGRDAARATVRPELSLTIGNRAVTLEYQRPLGDSGVRGVSGEAEAALTKAQLEEQALRRALRDDLRLTLLQLTTTHDNYRIVQQAIVETRQQLARVARQVAAGELAPTSTVATTIELRALQRQQLRYRLDHALGTARIRLLVGGLPAADGDSIAIIANDFRSFP